MERTQISQRLGITRVLIMSGERRISVSLGFVIPDQGPGFEGSNVFWVGRSCIWVLLEACSLCECTGVQVPYKPENSFEPPA